MKALESLRAAVAEIGRGTDPVSQRAYAAASAALVDLESQLAPKSGLLLLAGVDDSCSKMADMWVEGCVRTRSRLGVVEVSDIFLADPEIFSDDDILAQAKEASLDGLRVEIVRRNVAGASDGDLLEALDAADRTGDPSVGEIKVAALDRGLRRIG